MSSFDLFFACRDEYFESLAITQGDRFRLEKYAQTYFAKSKKGKFSGSQTIDEMLAHTPVRAFVSFALFTTNGRRFKRDFYATVCCSVGTENHI